MCTDVQIAIVNVGISGNQMKMWLCYENQIRYYEIMAGQAFSVRYVVFNTMFYVHLLNDLKDLL